MFLLIGQTLLLVWLSIWEPGYCSWYRPVEQSYGFSLVSYYLIQLSHYHIKAMTGETCVTRTAGSSCAFCICCPIIDDDKKCSKSKLSSCYSAASLRDVINSELWHCLNEVTGLKNIIVFFFILFSKFLEGQQWSGKKIQVHSRVCLLGCTYL